jgi:hypothetical protein
MVPNVRRESGSPEAVVRCCSIGLDFTQDGSWEKGNLMGRDAVATCHWRGGIAEVKLHLDGKSLNLRGNIRADLPRANITEIHQISEGVTLVVAGEPLLIEFNTIDAKRWVTALRKAPPTLALKLGVSTKQLAKAYPF